MKIEPMPEGTGALIARMAADDRKAASELAPSKSAGPAKVVAAVATGSVAGEKLSQRQFENIQSWLENTRRLEKLTPRELIAECLKSDAADYDVTVELMNRLLPGWQNEPVGADDEPQNIAVRHAEDGTKHAP